MATRNKKPKALLKVLIDQDEVLIRIIKPNKRSILLWALFLLLLIFAIIAYRQGLGVKAIEIVISFIEIVLALLKPMTSDR